MSTLLSFLSYISHSSLFSSEFCFQSTFNHQSLYIKTYPNTFISLASYITCQPRIPRIELKHRKKKKKKMKLVWCPETASKAYIDTVKSCELIQESSVAELVSAMAGGWKPELIVETWSHGGVISTSMGLAVASRHTSGRHVCIVPDEKSRLEYSDAMNSVGMSPEIIVGEAEEVMGGLMGVDFLVVDCERKDFANVLRYATLSHRGAVLVCKNASPRNSSGFRWRNFLKLNARVVRSVYLPVGMGVELAHVAGTSTGNLKSSKGSCSRWIRHIDQESGEEHVYRR